MYKTSPKDVFMHLLAIIALYISALSFGALVFQYIDILFTDKLADYFGGSRDNVRWALSSLVVVFPVYIWASWVLAKDVSLHNEKRELKTRKWLYHFTLFAASVLIIGDIVALIYKFLGGDLSMRFLLKVLTVLFIAAAVFGYYLWNIRREEMASGNPRMRVFILGVLAVVAISIIYGFFVAGSPFLERMRRFDEKRIQDLQNIQWQVVNYWQRKEKLPESTDLLKDDISGYAVPRDPESGAPYEYRIIDKLQFELCVNFKTESVEISSVVPKPVFSEGRGVSENWTHSIGRECFSRTIDPELYPPYADKGRVLR